MASSSLCFSCTLPYSHPGTSLRSGYTIFAVRSEEPSQSKSHGQRRVWRPRKLKKKDDMLRYKMERVPFLEEQVRNIREKGILLAGDIERLLLSEENRFDFVNDVAAEAKEYVENNRDDYGLKKKAIFHVLSNRMNEAGFSRPEAYAESDPFKPPGPENIRIEETISRRTLQLCAEGGKVFRELSSFPLSNA